MYDLSVVTHVAAAVVGFGATFTYPVIQLVAERRDLRALPVAFDAILAISRFVAVPATALVGITGAYQVAAGPYALRDAWLAAGVALYVAVMLVAILYLAPWYSRAGEAARAMVAAAAPDEPVARSAPYEAATRRTAIVGPFVAAAVVVTLALMVLKPG